MREETPIGTNIIPEQAAEALQRARCSQEPVSTFPLTPRWYGPAVASALFVFFAAQDARSSGVTIAAFVVYGVAIAIMVMVASRRVPYQLTTRAWGRHSGVLTCGIGALSVAGAVCFVGLQGAGFVLPGTVSGLVMAIGFIGLDRRLRPHQRCAKASEGR